MNAFLQFAFYLVVLLALAQPLGAYMANVYEGRTTFPFTVTVPASFRGNTIRVTVAVRYQACTDEVCYPPRTKNLVLTARVV